MKKLALLMSGIFALGVFIATANSQPVNEQQEEKVRKTMELKLEHAKDALEGLAMEDYRAIAKHGQELGLLSLESSWQVLQTPKYAQLSADFRATANTLAKAGKERKLDSATLAYVEMTLQCVKCHKYVRSVKLADLQLPTDIEIALQR